MKSKILVLSRDPALEASLRSLLDPKEFTLKSAPDAVRGLSVLRRERPVVVLASPLEDWRELRTNGTAVPILLAAAAEDREAALAGVDQGAADFLELPLEGHRLRVTLQNTLERAHLEARVDELSRELRGLGEPTALLGRSDSFREVAELLQRGARSEVAMLLGGEPGTGKATAARRVHAKSSRATGAFVVVDARALPGEQALEELFGRAGVDPRPGAIEDADGGTLLLEHVEDLCADAQERLLSFLQTGELRRPGAMTGSRPSVRWILTTECALEELARDGRFSEELFFRIAVFPVALPPLRDRVEDIALFAQTFVERFGRAHGKDVHGITPAALQAFEAFPWPGNVRELENAIERAVILADGTVLRAEHLPSAVVRSAFPDGVPREADASKQAPGLTLLPPHEVLPFQELERRILLHALRTTGWNVQEAARRLKLGRATIYRKIDRYGLEREAG